MSLVGAKRPLTFRVEMFIFALLGALCGHGCIGEVFGGMLLGHWYWKHICVPIVLSWYPESGKGP